MHTGRAKQQRDTVRAALVPAILPPQQALTILSGELYYVVWSRGRFSNETLVWMHGRDVDEEKDFLDMIADPLGLRDL